MTGTKELLTDALSRSEPTFARAVVETAPVIALMLDDQGRVVRFNSHMTKLTGYSVDEVRGADWFETFVPDRERQRIRSLFDMAVSGVRTQGNVNPILAKDGEELLVQWFDTELVDDDGSLVGIVAIGLDVTEQTRREEAERQRQKLAALDTLASGVAHDFNNLLMGIIGMAHRALTRLPDDHAARRSVVEIQRSARRGASVVEQLLAFSRERVDDSRTAEVDEAVASGEDLMRALLQEDVELVVSCDAPGCCAGISPGRVEQILLNLAANSRHAMPRGGSFSIETARVELGADEARSYPNVVPGAYIRLTVADDGEGMEPSVIERAFEPFFTTKEPGAGTGLGLSTVYGIVRQVGGYVEVESEPGVGTRFRILLPIVSGEHAQAERVPDEPEPAPRSAAVLVVEDEPLVRWSVRHYLERAGHRVLEAEDGEQALRIARETPVDVLVSDMVLPKLSGAELGRQLQAHRPRVLVVYMSAYPKHVLVEQERVTEDDVVLVKPFEPEQLLAVVHGALAADPL